MVAAASLHTAERGFPYFLFTFLNSHLCIGCQSNVRNLIIKVQICLEGKK